MDRLLTKYDLGFYEATLEAEAAYPNECIGYISKHDEYVPLENVAEDPTKEAYAGNFDPRRIPEMAVLVHSHPDATNEPTPFDLQQQKLWGIPWAIINVNKGKAGKWRVFGD